ncbi:hypothetical protein I4U23_011220 [Adineta vaga]|nr:hypothetical protein I4U23_011220 [Adineta vaga]
MIEMDITTIKTQKRSKSNVKSICHILLILHLLICFIIGLILCFPKKSDDNSKEEFQQNLTLLQKRPIEFVSNISWLKRAQTVAGGYGQGNEINQLSEPNDMFVDKMNNIYIADSLNHRIIKWNEYLYKSFTIAGGNGKGNETNQLNYPTALFIDNEENIYIFDNGNNRIIKWNINRNDRIIIIEQIYNCSSIFVDQKLNIYLSEISNHRIRKWLKDSRLGQTIIRTNSPNGIYVHEKTGDIYVASYLDNSVKQFTENGLFIRQIGNNILKGPLSLIIHDDNLLKRVYIFIVDSEHHRILQIQIDNPLNIKTIAGINNESGNDQYHLNKPIKIQFDSNYNLLILDSNNHRIQKFSIINNNYHNPSYLTSSMKSTTLSTSVNVQQSNYQKISNNDGDDDHHHHLSNEKHSPIDDTFVPQPNFDYNRQSFDINRYQSNIHNTWHDSSIHQAKPSSFRKSSFRKG